MKPRRRRHRFGPRAMAAVVEALDGGASVAEAARAAGFCASTLYAWRRKAPHFAAAWAEAAAASAAPALIRARNGTGWQMVRIRRRRSFTRELKEIFLGHFAATCCVADAARRTGVSRACVYAHRARDPAFRDGWTETCAGAVFRLEAETVARRLKAAEALKARGGEAGPEGAEEFDRTMQLLREHKRALAGEARKGRPPTRSGFDAAMEALEKRLRIFGVRIEAEGEDL